MSYITFSTFHTTALIKTELFVVDRFDISKSLLYSKSKKKEANAARFVAWYILYHLHHFPSTLIGDHFKRDHSTILSGVQKVKLWEWDLEIERQYLEQFPAKPSVPQEAATMS